MKNFLTRFAFLGVFFTSLAFGAASLATSCTPVGANTPSLILYPWGPATTVALTATGNQTIAIRNNVTIIDGVTTAGTNARTLILSIDAHLMSGAHILVKTKNISTTRTTVFSTGFTAPTITADSNKTYTQGFIYDGTVFLPCGTSIKIN